MSHTTSHAANYSGANNTWWSRRWQILLKQLGLEVSAESVRGSRVKRMEVLPGTIQAQVQDRELGAATVEICLDVLDAPHWEQVIDALSSQALYAAQLLAGNMPPEIEQIFAQAGAALLPESLAEIRHSCSACAPSAGKLCRPLAAVYWQLGEMLAEDPWLLLRLRGCERQQVLAGIHERRNVGAEAPAAPSTPVQVAEAQMAAFYTPDPAQATARAEDAPALDVQVNDYWGRRKVLEDIHHHLARPVVELALLRRLGPPTPTPDGQDAYGQLQTVYRRVTDRVWALAFEPEAGAESDE
jgi:uncharacterized Zn finger protein